MSSIGSAWPDDDMPDDGMDGMNGGDLSFLGADPGSPQPPTGIIPVTVTAPQTPSLIPVSPQDQSATQVPLSAYASAPMLQDPNAGTAPTPSAAGIGKALDWAGYFPDGAATAAKNVARWSAGDQTALDALRKTTPYFTVPLAIGSGIAGIANIHQRASPADAIVGNIIRGALVYGAGAGAGALTEGIGSIPASIAADHYLPPAPQIGHAIVQGILNPPSLPNLYPAYDPASLEAFGG